MIIHISLGGIGTIYAEGAWAYGYRPAWKLSRFGHEFVLDVPFIRVIATPAECAHRPSAQPCFKDRVGQIGWASDETSNDEKHGNKTHNGEKQWPVGHDRDAAITAEDRS